MTTNRRGTLEKSIGVQNLHALLSQSTSDPSQSRAMDTVPVPLLPRSLCDGHPLALYGESFGALVMSWEAALRVRQLDAPAPATANPLARTTHKYVVDAEGTAHIPLAGVMLPEPDWFLDWLGVDYTVTSHFTQAIADVSARADVRGVQIHCNSPGGSVHGLQEAFAAIAASSKPVTVTVEGVCGSAAYYVASAADQIIASPTAIVGSIGTMTTSLDVSQMLERIGIKNHLIASGPQKGTGTPGVPLTEERKRPIQAIVDALAAQFRSAVESGRGMTAEAVAAIATGEAWIASRALALGLIDAVTTTPSATAATTIKDQTMLTKDAYKSLCKTHPKHVALIDKLDAEQKDQPAIEAAIKEADQQAVVARVAELEGRITAMSAEHATALAAAKTEATTAQTKLTAVEAELAALKGHIPQNPSVGAGTPPPKAKPEPLTMKAFNALTPTQQHAHLEAGGETIGD